MKEGCNKGGLVFDTPAGGDGRDAHGVRVVGRGIVLAELIDVLAGGIADGFEDVVGDFHM